jgi:hypothetical protein
LGTGEKGPRAIRALSDPIGAAMSQPWYIAIAVSVVTGVVTALVTAFLQHRSASRLERQRAAEIRRQDQQRAEHSAALEQVKADLGKLTELSTSSERKRADVAAEVLVAVLRMLDALEGATSLGMFTQPSGVDRSDRAARQRAATLEVEAREASVKPYAEEFRRAWHMAHVFLPDDVLEVMSRINTLRREILANQQSHAFFVDDPSSGSHQFYLQGYGDQPQKKLAALRDQANALLRPIAQLGRTG